MPIFRRNRTRRERARARREARLAQQAQRFARAKTQRSWVHFLAYLGHYQRTIAWIIVLILIGGVLEIVLPQLVRFVMDVIVPARDFALLNGVIVGGFALYLLHAAVRYQERKRVINFSLDLITEIRRDVFAYHLSLPLSFFERQGAGRLISKLTYSMSMIKILVETFAYIFLRELTTMTLIVISASFIDWRLTASFLLLVPILALYIYRLNRYMAEVAAKLQTKNDQILTILNRTYNAIKLHQIFGAAPRRAEELEKVLHEDKRFRSRRTLVYEGNAILISLFTSIVILCALWYGGRSMIMGELSSGDVTAYIIYLAMLLRPVSEFVRVCAYYQAGMIGVRSVFAVFEQATPLPEPENPKAPERRAGAVTFENVTFRHASGSGGVMHLGFEIQAGQRVLVLGPSGSGKSTLLALIMRLYDRASGRILIDGVDVKEMQRSDLMSFFTVILQDQVTIEDSLLSNVLMDSAEEDLAARIEQALTLCQQMRVDAKFLSRYRKFGEEIRGEGLGLSRGELQKIALLRAAAKDAPIVLMDDPVSLMDPRSQRQTIELALELFAGKTLFLASHQVPPGFRADWIMMLRNGRMEGQGSHPYLMEHSAPYRRLCRRAGPFPQNAI